MEQHHMTYDPGFARVFVALSFAFAIAAAAVVLVHMSNVPFTAMHWALVAGTCLGALALPVLPQFFRKR